MIKLPYISYTAVNFDLFYFVRRNLLLKPLPRPCMKECSSGLLIESTSHWTEPNERVLPSLVSSISLALRSSRYEPVRKIVGQFVPMNSLRGLHKKTAVTCTSSTANKPSLCGLEVGEFVTIHFYISLPWLYIWPCMRFLVFLFEAKIQRWFLLGVKNGNRSKDERYWQCKKKTDLFKGNK
mgnify:CR=1 FL=1